ncbi:MAG: hypothetical protein AAFQ89_21485 [Cyanobacteria bacterium J06626_18]
MPANRMAVYLVYMPAMGLRHGHTIENVLITHLAILQTDMSAV